MKTWFLLIGLLLLLSISANVRFLVGSRASSNDSTLVSQENSYLSVSPLKARPDGKDKIRLTVVVLDAQGRGVSNQDVVITTKPSESEGEPSIQYEGIQTKTDLYGRAIYDFYTSAQGKYEIEASVGGSRIGEVVMVEFE